MGDIKVSKKGVVVLPAELRRLFGMNTGCRLLVFAVEKQETLILVKSEHMARFFRNAENVVDA
jgi:AbrB family looped-hinge helix DNA binding protein